MGIFGEKRRFFPGCKVKQDPSNPGRTVLECSSKLERPDGSMEVPQRPIVLIKESNRRALIQEDGGASDELLNKLIDWVEKKHLK